MSIETETSETLQLGTHRFNSRLIVGTGKYANYELMGESLERSQYQERADRDSLSEVQNF